MFGYIYSSMLRDMLRLKRLAWWLLIMALMLGIGSFVARYSVEADPVQTFKKLSEMMMFRVVALISAILSTAVVSAEVEQRTIVYLLVRPIRRPVLLIARTLASMTVVALLGSLLMLGTSVIVFGPNLGANAYLGSSLAAVVLGALAYGAVFVMISLVLNRALIYCLLFAFGWELLLPNMPGGLNYGSVLSHMKGVANIPVPPPPPNSFMAGFQQTFATDLDIPRNTAILTLTISSVVLVALGAWWFNTREFVPREDAE